MGDKLLLCCEESDKYKLFEVSEDVFSDLENSGRVCIKGKPADEAVLCTSTQTYSIRLAVSSNSLLLTPDVTNSTKHILASLSSYYELSKVVPRLSYLRDILAKSHYSGLQDEATKDTKQFLTFHDVSKLVQASDAELMKGLKDIDAFELDGYWRLLAPSFAAEVVDSLLTNATIHGWPFQNLDEQVIISIMDEYDPRILLHVLAMFGNKPSAKWQLDIRKLSVFRAQQLLMLGESRKGGDWRLADFISAWQDSAPEGAPTDVESLKGLAVVVQQGKESMVRSLPAADLRSISDPKGRLQHLFKVQPQWSLADLLPYLGDLAPSTAAAQSLVLKHARAIVTPTGATYYCAREV